MTATAGAVTIPSTLSAALSQTALSAEAWVYLDAGSTGLRPIVEESFGVDGNRGFSLMVDETGRLAAGTFLFASGGWFRTAETAVFPTNQWTHVAATYDGTRFRIYRNGTKVAESGVMSRPPNLDPWLISTNGGNRWRGMIDDVAVYAYALSEAQVQTHAREQDASDAACDLCPNDPSASCVPTVCVDADQDGYGAQGVHGVCGWRRQDRL